MKKIIIPIIISFLFIVSCGNDSKKVKTEDEKQIKSANENAQELELDIEKSIINWKGSKPASYHNGTISLKSGTIMIEDNQISAASIIVDMNSIKNIDVENVEYNQKLIGHLMSADFFDVEQFPEAKFELTSIEKNGENYLVSGNLTVKDKIKNISFPVIVKKDDKTFKISADAFTIDRTDWDIKYNSGKFFSDLKDNLILDDIEISFEIITR